MARKDWYTIRDNPSSPDYDVVKVDENFQPIQTYHVGKQPGGICDCWAGSKFCRHRKMVPIFKAEGAINSGRLYNFDKATWYQAPQDQETETDE